MFAPVWQEYRGQLLFGAALVVYGIVAAVGLIASNSWLQLSLPLFGGALLFFLLPVLRRFAGIFLLIAAGSLAVVAGGELLFRARYFGGDALLRFTDYSPIPPTQVPGFVAPAADPELGYVFTPGASARLNGKEWQINEAGFRDRSFSQEKPADVFRILVLGDSFALGSGVGREERFSSQLEGLLGTPDGRRLEIYNLGLAGLDLEQLSHLLETHGPRYRGDLILVGLRASQLREKRKHRPGAGVARDFAERQREVAESFSFPRRYAFVLNVQREAVRAALSRARGLVPFTGNGAKQEGKAAGEGSVARFETFVRGCSDYTERNGAPVVIVALRKMEFASDQGLRATLANRALGGDASRRDDHEEIARITAELGVPYVDTYDAFGPEARRSDYIVFPGDGHPNAAGHRRYAEAIAAWLREHVYPRPPAEA